MRKKAIWITMSKTLQGVYLEISRRGKSERTRYYSNYECAQDITPSSLRRVCRLLQGQPALGEAEQMCEWKMAKSNSAPTYTTACGCHWYFSYTPGEYCPHCGRKIKEVME